MFQLFVVVPGLDCRHFSEFLSTFEDLEYRVPNIYSSCSDVMYSIRMSSYTEENGYEIDEDGYYCEPVVALKPSIEDLMAYIMPRRWKYEIFYN